LYCDKSVSPEAQGSTISNRSIGNSKATSRPSYLAAKSKGKSGRGRRKGERRRRERQKWRRQVRGEGGFFKVSSSEKVYNKVARYYQKGFNK